MNSIIYKDIKFITANDGTFFDLIDKSSQSTITDYHALKKKIILSEDGTLLRLDGEKKRLQINTIDDLRNAIDGYISAALQIYRRFYSFDFSDIDKSLLAEQLIFDILFDKCRHESEKMTQYGYASSDYLKDLRDFGTVPNTFADKVRNSIKRGMKKYSNMIRNSPQLQEELAVLGIDPDKYVKSHSPKVSENKKKKKSKFEWNYIFFNQFMITSRQYRRQLKEDGNYSCETFVDDLKFYNSFVEKMLPVENESPKKYFEKSMDYYYLESYKRIDFIFKLMNIIPKIEAENEDYYFLVKQFKPKVFALKENDGQLFYEYKDNYYRPLFMIENELHKQIQNSDKYDQSLCGIRLVSHQFIRARVYELLNYHLEYISSDYEDIKKFISQHYNMLSYHQSNEIWNKLPDKSWKKLDKETQAYFRLLKKNFITINRSFFWESPKRKPTISDK